ncbi:MAG TPA: PKD domain-containing protein [Verrucomicrobiales bacterium]|nr:PKD domain-containing protein [Verrucomicrobiales bacterium]
MLHYRTNALLVTLFISAAIAREAVGQAPEAAPFPAVSLPQTARGGAQVINHLGSKLPAVARWYGHTEAEFRNLCAREHALSADRHGRLFYSCAGPAVQASTAGDSGTVAAGAFPDAQTFQLHSKPGATKVIYLDFDGHTTTGTPWNTSFAGGASIVTPPYDRDGVAGFSSSELGNIQEIWQRVSEDYAPFDVDVTTQDPGVEALRKTTSSDAAYGVRVCIGGSSYTWYGGGAGGVAYLGSFNWNTDSPAFVFPAQLGNGNPKYVAEAASHETGHTLSLHHDGAKDDPATSGNEATEYYQGHANWAPIMGVGYYKDVVQFSKGDYPNANNKEDDFTLIKNFIPLRADEHGDGITTATLLSGASLSASGIISSRTDADLFKFTTNAGSISLSAAPAAVSPNLDVGISLYDGTGALITYSNASTLGTTLNANVPAGTYYAANDGAGAGNPLTSYDDYGSIGVYSFSGTVVPAGNQPPVAVVSQSTPTSGTGSVTVAFSSAGSSDPDGTIVSYDWDFGDGTSSTAANPSHTYSTPGTYNASLVVFDNGGLSSSAHLTITVNAASQTQIYVSDIRMLQTSNAINACAGATVYIKDTNGLMKPGAVVTGTWSGSVTGTSTGTTNSNGTVFLVSPSTATRSGLTYTFTVTGVSASGCTYAPSLNVKSSGTITKP